MLYGHAGKKAAAIWHVAILVALVGVSACSGSGSRDDDSGGGNGGSGKGTPPSATLSPVGELGLTQPLTLSFTEAMDPDSVTLDGSLAVAVNREWQSGDEPNDTLVITPVTSWTSGTQTLRIDGNDTDGDVLATINANYDVHAVIGNFAPAVLVIGQSDFAGGSVNQGGSPGANTLDSPVGGAALAGDGSQLFISDTGSSRVLGYNGVPVTNNANANFVIGQPDFTSTTPATTAAQLRTPQSVSTSGGVLVVTDTQSHRVVLHAGVPANGPANATVVVGQADMQSSEVACDATSLNTPEAHFVTPDGKLIVADSANNRVLIWNALPTVNAQPPDLVLGQGDFVHCTANDDDQDATPSPDWPPHAHTMRYPTGIWSDGERLLVADSGNHRVLIWNSFPGANFAAADHVIGQNSFRRMAPNDDDQDGQTDADGTASARVFSFPFGVWSSGGQIFVADRDNNRVLVWNTVPTRFFTPADAVIGQANFEHNAANDIDQDGTGDGSPSRSTLNAPTGVRLDGNRLMITDGGNSRVLIFETE